MLPAAATTTVVASSQLVPAPAAPAFPTHHVNFIWLRDMLAARANQRALFALVHLGKRQHAPRSVGAKRTMDYYVPRLATLWCMEGVTPSDLVAIAHWAGWIQFDDEWAASHSLGELWALFSSMQLFLFADLRPRFD